DLLHTEEKVAQDLLDRERQKSRVLQELESMERHLGQSAARRDTLQADLQYPSTELDSLRDTEREIQALQCEVDEDTTEVIPSAIYLAQLYHKVTKIKWEYDTEPHVLRGVHYGGDIVTPININTAEQSPGFVSDYLWGLISTEW
ncbi:SPC24 protein, partial [Amia calva]|nr:SPC24 protein [Amia calva]